MRRGTQLTHSELRHPGQVHGRHRDLPRLTPLAKVRPVLLAVVAVAVLVALAGTAFALHSQTGLASSAVNPALLPPITGDGQGTAVQVSVATLETTFPQASFTARTVKVDGLTRTYLVIAPPHRTGSSPALVVLHGSGASATQEAMRDEFIPLVEHDNLVLLYPVGYAESWNAGSGCCKAAGSAGIDDVAFIHAVVKQATAALDLQPNRIYLSGLSNGAKMTYTVACALPGLFAAFAPVGGEPAQVCQTASQPPMSMLLGIGSADIEAGVYGQLLSPSVALTKTASIWLSRDGCSPLPKTTTEDIATITSYEGCSGNSRVETVYYAGLVHAWPVAAPNPVIGTVVVPPAISMATVIWTFFSDQPTRS